MIFGTMPMSLEGRSSKMHFLPSLDLVRLSRHSFNKARLPHSIKAEHFFSLLQRCRC
jgi:hypothetical protein